MRVPARNDAQARDRYLRFLQRSLSCISPTIWLTSERLIGTGAFALTTAIDPIRLVAAEGNDLFFSATQYFHFEDSGRYAGERKVRTDGYAYRLRTAEDRAGELIQWHWHPQVGGRSDCHLHVGAMHGDRPLRRLHIPTGRISFEEVILFLFDEFGIAANRPDHEDVLADSRQRFEAFRSWPSIPPRPDRQGPSLARP